MTDLISTHLASNVLHVELTLLDKYNALADAMYVALNRVFAKARACGALQVGAERLLLCERFDDEKARKLGIINAMRVTRRLMCANADQMHTAIDREAVEFVTLRASTEARAIFQKFLKNSPVKIALHKNCPDVIESGRFDFCCMVMGLRTGQSHRSGLTALYRFHLS